MAKHISNKIMIKMYRLYMNSEMEHFWKEYAIITGYKTNKDGRKNFRKKFYKWQLNGYNIIECEIDNRGRPRKIMDKKKRKEIIGELNREQLEEIVNRYFEITDEKIPSNKIKESANLDFINKSVKAKLFGFHRTLFYKKKVKRVYKFESHYQAIKEIAVESNYIYGSRRIGVKLSKKGVNIGDRQLRNILNRIGVKCAIRVSRRKSEVKNTKVKYDDLVKRNYNPIFDNIIATDVSYIPASSIQNYVYLSVAISHKTKLIESWEISKHNDVNLVYKTIKSIKNRDNLIIHSDHGFQYSSTRIKALSNRMKYKISMSRIGNSLDNREAEYFFSCIKSECLSRINTSKLNIDQIKVLTSNYICWYNNKRINGALNWKTPAQASVYA